MKRYLSWRHALFLLLLAFLVQGCFGIGEDAKDAGFTDQGGGIKINSDAKATFSGKLYFTLSRNLYVLEGKNSKLTALTKNKDIRDPAVSPDGKTIALIGRAKQYSDLAYMPAKGGVVRVLNSGNGVFQTRGGDLPPVSTHHWQAQPAWSADGKTLLFVADLHKADYYDVSGIDAPWLDPEVFSIPFDKSATPQVVALSSYGFGGNRDPSFRPGKANEMIYTHYAYGEKSEPNVQIFMSDTTIIPNSAPGTYRPNGSDAGIAITPSDPKVSNIQPAFSPNGKYIVYVRNDGSGQMGLYTMPVPDGVTATPNDAATAKKALANYKKSALIYKNSFLGQPVWSPDGKSIAFVNYTNNTFDIWLVKVTLDQKSGNYKMTESPIQLTNANGKLDADSRPFWSAK